MVLHCIAGTTIVDHSTTSRANIASLLRGAGGIGAESSVQVRNGVIPNLIGLDALEDAVPTVNEVKVSLNTWDNTDYLTLMPQQLTAVYGNREPYRNVGAPIPLEMEADWDVDFQSEAADGQFVNMLLSYGTPTPRTGGKLIWRKGAVTAADYGITGAFGTAISISDLFPGRMYRVAYLGGLGGADCGILRYTAPSFHGMYIQTLIPQAKYGGTWFPFDSQVQSGYEKGSLDASGGAASACEYAIAFEEVGSIAPAQNVIRGGTGRGSPYTRAGRTTAPMPKGMAGMRNG